MTVSNPTREEIAARAYLIWEAEGQPEGRALAHWLEAEDELAVGPAYVRPAGREDMDMAPATWSRTDEEATNRSPPRIRRATTEGVRQKGQYPPTIGRISPVM